MKLWEQIMLTATAGLLGAGLLLLANSQPRGDPISLQPPPTPIPLQVHIEGAVENPGLYALPAQSRVQDAIDAAGGLLENADLEMINLAAFIIDGEKLHIPFSAKDDQSSTRKVTDSDNNPLININTASLSELETLPGIGPTTAQSIIAHRQQYGPFTQIEQIMNVPGIGPTTFEQIKGYITVDDTP